VSHVSQKFKLPGENLSIPIDFVDSLISTSPAESIISASATARLKDTQASIAGIVDSVTFSGSVVTVRIIGGTSGQRIEIDVLANTDLATSPAESVGHRIDMLIE